MTLTAMTEKLLREFLIDQLARCETIRPAWYSQHPHLREISIIDDAVDIGGTIVPAHPWSLEIVFPVLELDVACVRSQNSATPHLPNEYVLTKYMGVANKFSRDSYGARAITALHRTPVVIAADENALAVTYYARMAPAADEAKAA